MRLLGERRASVRRGQPARMLLRQTHSHLAHLAPLRARLRDGGGNRKRRVLLMSDEVLTTADA